MRNFKPVPADPSLRHETTRAAATLWACLLLFFACAAAAQAGPPDGCIDLYEHADLQGASIRICGEGDHWLPYDPGAGVDWHYRVSSFQCGAGVDLARFVNGNAPSYYAVLECSQGAYGLPGLGFDNGATNVEIVDIPADCVELFEEPYDRGASYRVCGDGDHWLPYDPAAGVNWHYRVSSFACGENVHRVTLVDGNRPGVSAVLACTQGWGLPVMGDGATNVVVETVPADCVQLYEHPELLGASYRVCGEGDHWLPYDPGAGVDWHYRVSSFRCGPGVSKVNFVNGNAPANQAELRCADGRQLATVFDDQATNVEVEYVFDCAPWDGGVPAVGSYLRFTNAVVKDGIRGRSTYRTDLAGKYLVNALHGSDPVPKFVGQESDSRAALYQVVDSRFHAHGPEIRLQSPPEGLAAATAVGFHHAPLITSAHSYWGFTSEWMRLAHTYRAWTDSNCRDLTAIFSDKVAPTAVLQRVIAGDGYSCSQEWSHIYQFTSCDDYYVSMDGCPAELNPQLARHASDVEVEVCSVR